MRVTQQDIARIARVSQATVSRVVSGDEKVEPAIRDRVLGAMTEHHYAPDVRARQLRNKRAGLIGLVLNRPHGGLADDPFVAALIGDILEVLVSTEYHLCLDLATGESGQTAVYEEMLRTRRVDGLILVESEASDPRLGWLARREFPFVLIGNPPMDGPIHSVDNDNVAASRLATEHLLERGYRRIAFLGGRPGVTVSEDRIAGYREALGDLPRVVRHAEFGAPAAGTAAKELLRDHPDTDALVVLDDDMAVGAIMAARGLGRTVGSDLGVVSFNDSRLCGLVDGGLSSVTLHLPRIVEAAVARLLDVIEGRSGGLELRQIIPAELRARGSSVGRKP